LFAHEVGRPRRRRCVAVPVLHRSRRLPCAQPSGSSRPLRPGWRRRRLAAGGCEGAPCALRPAPEARVAASTSAKEGKQGRRASVSSRPLRHRTAAHPSAVRRRAPACMLCLPRGPPLLDAAAPRVQRGGRERIARAAAARASRASRRRLRPRRSTASPDAPRHRASRRSPCTPSRCSAQPAPVAAAAAGRTQRGRSGGRASASRARAGVGCESEGSASGSTAAIAVSIRMLRCPHPVHASAVYLR
jgi:hypothetical protein